MKIHHQKTSGSIKISSNSLRTNFLTSSFLFFSVLTMVGKGHNGAINLPSLSMEEQIWSTEKSWGEEDLSKIAFAFTNTTKLLNPNAFVLVEVGTRVIGKAETTCWIGWLPRKNSSNIYRTWAKTTVYILTVSLTTP